MLCREQQTFLRDWDVTIPEDQELFVLPALEYTCDFWIFSDQEPIPWVVFSRGLVNKTGGGDEARAPAAARPRARALPAWAQAWLAVPASASGGHASSEGGAATSSAGPASDEPLTAEQEAEVEREVAEMRAWLSSVFTPPSEEFGARILGCKWTKRHRGVAWDAVQGFARTDMAKSFCTLFEFHHTMRFGRGDFSRDEALLLVEGYCLRMAHYFSIWQDMGFGPMDFDAVAEDLDSVDDLELVEAMLAADDQGLFYEAAQRVRALRPGQWQGYD